MVQNWRKLLFGSFVLLGAVFLVWGFFSLDLKLTPVSAAVSYQYTVKKGDSLYIIARNNGISVGDLKQANNLQSDLIYPGQVLSIPAGLGGEKYTVRKGDTLFLIAARYCVSVDAIKQSNGLKTDLIVPGQVLNIPKGNGGQAPANTGKSLGQVLRENPGAASRLTILVDKSDHTLSILSGGVRLKSYHVELGDSGMGDKAVAGDHKTPEGTFYICEKSVLNPADPYLGSRWMRLSYPNIEDADRGLNQGLIDQGTHNQIVTAIRNGQVPLQRTALGGGVGIHGGSTPALGKDWTWGCVGLTNRDVEDFYDFVGVGTPVIIQK